MASSSATESAGHHVPSTKPNSTHFSCCLCAKMFPNHMRLEGHLSSEHVNYLPYQCHFCDFVRCPTAMTLLEHFRTAHKGKRWQALFFPELNHELVLNNLMVSSTSGYTDFCNGGETKSSDSGDPNPIVNGQNGATNKHDDAQSDGAHSEERKTVFEVRHSALIADEVSSEHGYHVYFADKEEHVEVTEACSRNASGSSHHTETKINSVFRIEEIGSENNTDDIEEEVDSSMEKIVKGEANHNAERETAEANGTNGSPVEDKRWKKGELSCNPKDVDPSPKTNPNYYHGTELNESPPFSLRVLAESFLRESVEQCFPNQFPDLSGKDENSLNKAAKSTTRNLGNKKARMTLSREISESLNGRQLRKRSAVVRQEARKTNTHQSDSLGTVEDKLNVPKKRNKQKNAKSPKTRVSCSEKISKDPKSGILQEIPVPTKRKVEQDSSSSIVTSKRTPKPGFNKGLQTALKKRRSRYYKLKFCSRKNYTPKPPLLTGGDDYEGMQPSSNVTHRVKSDSAKGGRRVGTGKTRK